MVAMVEGTSHEDQWVAVGSDDMDLRIDAIGLQFLPQTLGEDGLEKASFGVCMIGQDDVFALGRGCQDVMLLS